MKTLLTAVLMLLIAVPLLAASNLPAGMPNTNYLPDITRINVDKAQNAKGAPLTFTGTDTVSAEGDSVMTRWLQLGYARGSTLLSNTIPQMFNPEFFTLIIELDICAGGDSIGLAEALFEVCFDTTETDLIELTLTDFDSTFTIGETVTGTESGATGIVKSKTRTGAADADSILFLHSVEGVFNIIDTADNIIGGTSGSSDMLASKTTLKNMAARNNDGSSIFCVDGSLTHFATWVSEEISITSDVKNVQKYVFPLRVLTPGAYIRFQYTSAVLGLADDVKVKWELKCEH